MKHLLQNFKLYLNSKLLISLAILTSICQCVAELYLPLIMSGIINDGVLKGNMDVVSLGGKKMIVATAVMVVCGYITSMTSAVAAQRYALRMRKILYAHISTLSPLQIQQWGTGSVITRLTADISNVTSFFNTVILLFVDPAILLVGSIIMMLNISRLVGIVYTAFTLIQATVILLFMRMTAPRFKKLQQLIEKFQLYLQSAFSNLQLIKMFSSEGRALRSFEDQNEEIRGKSYAVQRIVAVFNPIIMLIMNMAVACILIISGLGVNSGAMATGNLLAAITYSEQILLSITVSGQLMGHLAAAVPSAQRVDELLNLVGDLPEGQTELGEAVHTLAIKDVSFSYPGKPETLMDLNLELYAGETVALLGNAGSGKSTLACLLSRVFDPTKGVVTANGVSLSELTEESLHRHIAITEKQAQIFDGSFEDNIRFGRDGISDEDIKTAARLAQCEDFINQTSEGLKSHVAQMGVTISGGERQRLTIARALAGKPDLLILDDATSSLDYATESRLMMAVRQEYPRLIIVLITQRAFSARIADRIVFLGEKTILGTGTDSSLRASCPAYERFLRSSERNEA